MAWILVLIPPLPKPGVVTYFSICILKLAVGDNNIWSTWLHRVIVKLTWSILVCSKRHQTGTPLVVQWLRICLPMWGMWVPSLVGEVDPTRHRTTKLAHSTKVPATTIKIQCRQKKKKILKHYIQIKELWLMKLQIVLINPTRDKPVESMPGRPRGVQLQKHCPSKWSRKDSLSPCVAGTLGTAI